MRRAALSSLLWRALLAVGCWLVWAVQARADVGRAHLILERSAQSSCPTREAIEHDVEGLAGHPVFTGDPRAATQVRCEFYEHASGVTAHIDVRDKGGAPLGTRELSAAPGDCGALRESIAVVLLMLLDREPEPAELSTAPARKRSTRPVGLGPSSGAILGVLPRAGAGVGLVAVPQINERFHARVDAGYWFPVRVQTSQGHGGTFRAFIVAAALCTSLWQGSRGLELSLCGGAQLAVIQASARNLLVEHREASAFGQGFLPLELSARWSTTELRADLGPTLAVTRPRFTMLQADGSERDVHQPARFGAMFRLALIIWAP